MLLIKLMTLNQRGTEKLIIKTETHHKPCALFASRFFLAGLNVPTACPAFFRGAHPVSLSA